MKEKWWEAIFLGCGSLSFLVTAGVIIVLFGGAISFFGEVSLGEFLTSTKWTPLFVSKNFGIWPLITGTFLVAAIAMAVALPLGLCSAIYLSEFASPKRRAYLKPALEILAGIPTVVYGYFALLVVTPLLQKIVPGLALFNALSAGIVMGFMITPMVSSLSEDVISAIPFSLREAGLSLGATPTEVVVRVTLPAAASGIGASVILALSRAIGETMIVTIACGQIPRLTLDPRVPIATMTAYIVQVGLGDIPTGTIEYKTIYAVGAMLFLMTLFMNVISHLVVRRFRERYE